MRKSVFFGALAATMLLSAAGANAATVVNVDGVANASTDGSNAVNVLLGAGTYNVTFTDADYQAFSRFSGESGCDAQGLHCVQGFENSVKYTIGGQTFGLGDGRDIYGPANGGLGPQVPGNGYYATPGLSLANAGSYRGTFTLGAPTTVGFFLFDDNLGDNRGGVSLNIAAVPEPSTWAMMLFGFGAVGFGMRRRREKAAGTPRIRFSS